MNSNQPHPSHAPEPSEAKPDDASRSGAPKREINLSTILLDCDGLRPVWGIALFLLLLEILRDFLFPLAQSIFPASRGASELISPRNLFVPEAAGLLCVLLATGLMAKIESRPVAEYGFAPSRGLRNFLAGGAWGAALLSLLVFTLRAAGLLTVDTRLLFGRRAVGYGVLWVAGFLLVAALEEVYLRGYLQFALTRGLAGIYRRLFGPAHANALGFWTAAMVLSVFFASGHRMNPGESPIGLLAAGLIGLAFCLSLWRTGSLWWAIGFHASWDWAQSYLYGVADSGLRVQGHLFATHPAGSIYLSGGLTGPEGSLFVLPIILAVAAAIRCTLPRTHIGYTPVAASRASLH